MKHTALLCLTTALSLVASAADKPNFIFILSDDIAQGDVGIYGQEIIQNEMIRAKPTTSPLKKPNW